MKKILALILSVLMLLTLAACSTKTVEGDGSAKKFSVTVVHADGSEKKLDYETDAAKLGGFLEEQGLIQSEGADDGMFHTVDGEKADWNVNQSYWAFYVGEEYAISGIYDTAIEAGAAYKLVYTIG